MYAGNFFDSKYEPFTHVIIDEAAQTTEPECLIPVAVAQKSRVILAGDPKQLGAVVKSKMAKKFGLDVSLMERLMGNNPYKKNADLKDGYDSKLITKLTKNYR